MWRKEESTPETPAPDERALRPDRSPAATDAARSELATIGRSITIRGDVTGDEDLLVQGRVEGSIDLQQHSVTVGADGEVNASISARIVTIEGRVEGNIRAEEQATLRSSAFVRGDITAPRVVLENGARFRGGVDMGDADERAKKTLTSSSTRQNRASEAGRPAVESVATPAREPTSLVAKGNGESTASLQL
jgi:cytoskeletal protein CcmA (bactofilin family)